MGLFGLFGGGGGSSTNYSYTSNMPTWVEDAHRRLISEAEPFAMLQQTYPEWSQASGPEWERMGHETGYLDPEGNLVKDYGRIAGFDPYEQAAFGGREQMYTGGDPYGDYAANMMGIAGQTPEHFRNLQSYYGPQEFDFDNMMKFTPERAQEYMNPYTQAVINPQIAAAQDEYARQLNTTAAEKVASGATGGYREAMQEAIGGGLHQKTVADITGRGLQKAWGDAQQQFERDRGAAIQAARMGDASRLQAAQQAMAVDLENQKRLQWQGGFAQDLAKTSTDIGTISQNRALQRIQELERAGASRREMTQARKDLIYDEFRDRYDYPKTQMSWLQGILSGLPGNMEQRTETPGPTMISQLAGLGLTAAGFQQMFGE